MSGPPGFCSPCKSPHLANRTGLWKDHLDISDRIAAWTLQFCEPVCRCVQRKNFRRTVATGGHLWTDATV
jgi:hypothetical protein